MVMSRAVDQVTAANRSREFLLVCACCVWRPSEAHRASIRSRAKEIADWEHVLAIAGRHRVLGLVHHALCSAEVALPQAVRNTFAACAQAIARLNLQMAAEILRLQKIFDDAGIRAISVKGVGLGQLAYGTPAVKDSRDIDLLVEEGRATDALTLMESNGYKLSAPAADLNEALRRAFVRHCIQLGLEHGRTDVQVELHWRLVSNRHLLDGVDVHGPTQEILLAEGRSIRTLARDDLFAYLCAHGAKHGWSRLKWLVDLSVLIADASEADIERLYRHAARRGAGYCAAQALTLCRDLLGLPLPAALEAEFGRSRRVARLVAIARHAMTGADPAIELEDRPSAKIGVVLSSFLLGSGMRFLLSELRAAGVSGSDIVLLRLPEWLDFLYLPLRPLLFLWRRWRYLLGRASWDGPRLPRAQP